MLDFHHSQNRLLFNALYLSSLHSIPPQFTIESMSGKRFQTTKN
jgi:hypothetical protein